MQYRFAVLALAGLAAAQSTSSSSAAAMSTNGMSTQEASCLAKCAAGDVNCQAQCVNVPFPNMSQANANTQCAMQCKQGDGSPEQTKQFGQCLADCASQHYYTSSGTLGPNAGSAPTASSGSGSEAASGPSPTTTGSSGSGAGASNASGSPTNSGSMITSASSGSPSGSPQAGSTAPSSSSTHSGAAATLVPIAGGMLGMAVAVLAL